MSKDRALLVAGSGIILAIAIALLIGLRSGTSSAVAATELDKAPIDAASDSIGPALPTIPGVSDRSTRDAVAAEASTPAPAPTVVATEPAVPEFPFDLHGQIVGLDSDGRELAPQNGHFQLTVWRGNHGESLKVDVRASYWQAQIKDARTARALSVGGFEFGELRPTLLQPEHEVPIPTSHELEIRVQVPRTVQLRVLDAVNGADLSGIELVRAKEFPMADATHPGAEFESRILGSELRSPIAMDPFRKVIFRNQNGLVLVGAHDYAWGLVKIDLGRGGEFVVSLERGGDLEVSVSGVNARQKAHLRLRAESKEKNSPICEEPLDHDGVLSFIGLVPGSYSVRAELGDWFDDVVKLGEANVVVSVGGRVRADIVLAMPPKPDRADIGGLVYVASEWKAKSPMLVMEQFSTPLDGGNKHATLRGEATASDREGFDAFRWLRRRAEIGKYEFGPFDPRLSVVIDVPPGGRDDFEMVVPPPFELSVYVVDEATGSEAEIGEVHWNPRRPEGVDGGILASALRDAPNHRFVVRAPAGEIQLRVSSWEYLPYSGFVDLSKGIREHTIRLQRSCGIILKMKDGDTLVAFPKDWMVGPTTVSGGGESSMSQYGEFERKFMLTAPGTYSIEIPKIPSYRAVPLQTIEVAAGRYTEHVVPLQRENP